MRNFQAVYSIYLDDELPDYIMVMIANKKDVGQMSSDLDLFLGDNSEPFTEWYAKSCTFHFIESTIVGLCDCSLPNYSAMVGSRGVVRSKHYVVMGYLGLSASPKEHACGRCVSGCVATFTNEQNICPFHCEVNGQRNIGLAIHSFCVINKIPIFNILYIFIYSKWLIISVQSGNILL